MQLSASETPTLRVWVVEAADCPAPPEAAVVGAGPALVYLAYLLHILIKQSTLYTMWSYYDYVTVNLLVKQTDYVFHNALLPSKTE